MPLKLRVVPHARTSIAAERAWPHARRSRPALRPASASTQAAGSTPSVVRFGGRDEFFGAGAKRVRSAVGDRSRSGAAENGSTSVRSVGGASSAGASSSSRYRASGLDGAGGGALAVASAAIAPARPTLDERLERFESFVSDRASAGVSALKRAAALTVDACSRVASIDDPALREVSSFLFFVAVFAAAFLI